MGIIRNMANKVGQSVQRFANRFSSGLIQGTEGLIYDGVQQVENIANELSGAINETTSKRYDLGPNGVNVPVQGCQGTMIINGKRHYMPGPDFKMDNVKQAKVYNGKDGKIDWGNVRNKELLSRPEIVQAIIKQDPESFKTLPREAFAMDPVTYGQAFNEGVMNGYDPAKHGSKSDYFNSMSGIFQDQQQALADYRKEKAAEAAARQQAAQQDKAAENSFEQTMKDFEQQEKGMV